MPQLEKTGSNEDPAQPKLNSKKKKKRQQNPLSALPVILVTVLMMILPNVISMKPEEISEITRPQRLCGVRPGQGDPTDQGAEQKLTFWVTHLKLHPLQEEDPFLI